MQPSQESYHRSSILILHMLSTWPCHCTQAAENAKNNQGASKSTLVVSEAFANQGPVMKRFRPRAQGR